MPPRAQNQKGFAVHGFRHTFRHTFRSAFRPTTAAAPLAAACLALAGCGGGDSAADAPSSPAASSASPASSGRAAALTVQDAWVKAADKGMTAAFGVLVNTTGSAITVASAVTPASPKVELHEVADSGGEAKMRPVQGGFTVPAGGRLELKPGGYHIMLMDLAKPIRPGDQVAFTLALAGGGTVEFTAVGKSFQGGNENYEPGAGH